MAAFISPFRTKTIYTTASKRIKWPQRSTFNSSSSSTSSFSPDSLNEIAALRNMNASTSTLQAASDRSSAKGTIIASLPRTPETLVQFTKVTSDDDTSSVSSTDSFDRKYKDLNRRHHCQVNKRCDISTGKSEPGSLYNITTIKFNRNFSPLPEKAPQPEKTAKKNRLVKPRRDQTTLREWNSNGNRTIVRNPVLEGRSSLFRTETENSPNQAKNKSAQTSKDKFKINEPNYRKKVVTFNLPETPNHVTKSRIPVSCLQHTRSLPKSTNLNCNQSKGNTSNLLAKNVNPTAQKAFVTDVEIFMPCLSVSKHNVVYKSSKVSKVTKRKVVPPDTNHLQQLKEKETKVARDLKMLMKYPAVKVAVTKINESTKNTMKELKEHANKLSPKNTRKMRQITADSTRGQSTQLAQRPLNISKQVEVLKPFPFLKTLPRTNALQHTHVPKVSKSFNLALPCAKKVSKSFNLALPCVPKVPALQRHRGTSLSPVFKSSTPIYMPQHRSSPANRRRDKVAQKLSKVEPQCKPLHLKAIKELDHSNTDFKLEHAHSFNLEDFVVKPLRKKAWSMNEWSMLQKKSKKDKTYKEIYLEQKALRSSGWAKREVQQSQKAEETFPDEETSAKKCVDLNNIVPNAGGEKQDVVQVKNKRLANKNYLLYSNVSSQKKRKEALLDKPKKRIAVLSRKSIPTRPIC